MTAPSPPTPPRSRRLLIVAGVLLVVAINVGIWARGVAAGRVVHVVNGTASVVRFTVDGGSSGEVPARGLAEVVVGEGRHVIEVGPVDGGPATRHEVVLETPLAQRFAARPAWVLNVGGAAALVLEEEEYGERAAGRARPAEVLFGEPWLALERIDVLFAPFPAQAEGGAQGAVLRRLDVLVHPPAVVLSLLPPARRLAWAELRLRVDPRDEALLAAYIDEAHQAGEAEAARVAAFLEAGLARRPVEVAWHRAWQDAMRAQGREADAIARVDAAIDGEPPSSALLYLRGRLRPSAGEALAAYGEALALDREDAWAWHARGLVLLGRGELEDGLRSCEEACRLRPGDAEMLALRDEARLLAGRLEPLEAGLRQALEERPRSLGLLRRLVEACAARGDLEAARAAQASFARAVTSQARGDPEGIAALGEAALLECAGDVAAVASLVEGLPPSTARQVHRLGVQLARSRDDARALDAAQALVDGAGPAPPLRQLLALSLAAARRGDRARAAALRERAAEGLADPRKGARDHALAALLRRDAPPDLADVRALPLPPADAAHVLLALAAIDPSAGAPLVEAARPLVAHGRLFPTRFLREVALELSR